MLVLSALDLAFIPVDVVLLMASTLPTPVLARLLTWLVAFCAAVLRLALLDVAEPRAAVEMKVDSKGGSGVSAHDTSCEAPACAHHHLHHHLHHPHLQHPQAVHCCWNDDVTQNAKVAASSRHTKHST